VFQNPKVRQKATPPAPLPGIARESSLKVLGVTLTQNISASDHVRGVINNSVPRRCMHCEYCGIAACVKQHYKKYLDLSSLLD